MAQMPNGGTAFSTCYAVGCNPVSKILENMCSSSVPSLMAAHSHFCLHSKLGNVLFAWLNLGAEFEFGKASKPCGSELRVACSSSLHFVPMGLSLISILFRQISFRYRRFNKGWRCVCLSALRTPEGVGNQNLLEESVPKKPEHSRPSRG